MKTIRLGIIGTGSRLYSLLRDAILSCEDVEINALCDISEKNLRAAAALVEEKTGRCPTLYKKAEELIADDAVETVLIGTDWLTHVEYSVMAMRAGKTVGCEVGGGTTVEDSWRLVRAYEETGTPVMFLENCCFGREELAALHMAKQGLFGDIVHCEGGYCHDCRWLLFDENIEYNFRLIEARNRNCEYYPTHAMGPLAKVLGLNRGNRILSLSSFASPAKGVNAYAQEKYGDRHPLAQAKMQQADVVTTVLTCAGGQTVTLKLNTSLPRWYSRCFQVQGTKALFDENSRSVCFAGEEEAWQRGNMDTYLEKYDHPMWKRFVQQGMRGQHGGMDGLMIDAFFAAVRENRPMPVDAYDMAMLMAITPLSEQSIALGGAPVPFPDFTNGRWMCREQEPAWAYSLLHVTE